jgi:hypothetical protein
MIIGNVILRGELPGYDFLVNLPVFYAMFVCKAVDVEAQVVELILGKQIKVVEPGNREWATLITLFSSRGCHHAASIRCISS